MSKNSSKRGIWSSSEAHAVVAAEKHSENEHLEQLGCVKNCTISTADEFPLFFSDNTDLNAAAKVISATQGNSSKIIIFVQIFIY
jgi:hypothetical protein